MLANLRIYLQPDGTAWMHRSNLASIAKSSPSLDIVKIDDLAKHLNALCSGEKVEEFIKVSIHQI